MPDSLVGDAASEEIKNDAARFEENSRRHWKKIIEELERSMVSGRINRTTASVVRVGILHALQGMPPLAWKGTDSGCESFSAPLEMEALRYVAAARAGFIDDLDPVDTVMSEFKIDERTYKRWRQRLKASAWSHFSVGETMSRNPYYWQIITSSMKYRAEIYCRRRSNKREDDVS